MVLQRTWKYRDFLTIYELRACKSLLTTFILTILIYILSSVIYINCTILRAQLCINKVVFFILKNIIDIKKLIRKKWVKSRVCCSVRLEKKIFFYCTYVFSFHSFWKSNPTNLLNPKEDCVKVRLVKTLTMLHIMYFGVKSF